MPKQLINIRQELWYQALVGECRATIVERVRNSREELIIGYGEVGQRIYKDPFYQKHGKGNREFNRRLFKDIGIGERTGYYCLQFYEKYIHDKFTEVCTAMQTLFPKEGKNISWNKIKTKYLPAPKEQKIPLPKGKYGVIYADPPWPYPKRYDAQNLYGAVCHHYDTMPLKEICNLPVKDLVADNAALFLWVATHFLEDSFKVFRGWGFRYKSNIVWIKERRRSGIGWYVRGDHELLLIATKGSYLPKNQQLVSSVIKTPIREHSRKPDEAYEIIEKLYPNDKYIELFARSKRKNWASWGDEI